MVRGGWSGFGVPCRLARPHLLVETDEITACEPSPQIDGNAEDFIGDAGAGTMEAIAWTNGTWGMSHHGEGRGPWIMADLENGLWGSDAGTGLSREE